MILFKNFFQLPWWNVKNLSFLNINMECSRTKIEQVYELTKLKNFIALYGLSLFIKIK